MELDKSLVSGSMGLLVMKLLEEKDMYGYEMIETLAQRSDHTFDFKAGTLYPILHIPGMYMTYIAGNSKEIRAPAATAALSATDVEAGICWAPEKEYEQGSWGYVGGQPFRPKTRHGTLPASDLDIWGTDKDPLFQTRRDGIEAFKADVPDGRYAIYLYLADLVAAGEKEVLPYNLGNDAVSTETGTTVVGVSVNGQQVLPAYDIRIEAGSQRAVIKKIQTDITEGQGLNIEFKALTGKAFLNAIRIVKLD